MTIEKSFEWLFKRFQNQNIKPCKFDIECITFLAEWVNREKAKTIRENDLFAKLYCHVFIQEINFYKDYNTAQRNMAKILMLPINHHYDLFIERLNQYELKQYSDFIGLLDKHPATRTDAEDEEQKRILKENEEIYIKHVKGIWDADTIYQMLNNQITESLNRFKNE